MKRYVWLWCVLATGLLAIGLRAEQAKTYYFQLIAGSNKELSPESRAKRVGAKLRAQLETKFRWKSYSEISHGECALSEHNITTVSLPEKRELQLELKGRVLEARLYRDGNLVRKTRESANSRSLIMGGDQGKDDSWFVVIRQDKPSTISVVAEEAKRAD